MHVQPDSVGTSVLLSLGCPDSRIFLEVAVSCMMGDHGLQGSVWPCVDQLCFFGVQSVGAAAGVFQY